MEEEYALLRDVRQALQDISEGAADAAWMEAKARPLVVTVTEHGKRLGIAPDKRDRFLQEIGAHGRRDRLAKRGRGRPTDALRAIERALRVIETDINQRLWDIFSDGSNGFRGFVESAKNSTSFLKELDRRFHGRSAGAFKGLASDLATTDVATSDAHRSKVDAQAESIEIGMPGVGVAGDMESTSRAIGADAESEPADEPPQASRAHRTRRADANTTPREHSPKTRGSTSTSGAGSTGASVAGSRSTSAGSASRKPLATHPEGAESEGSESHEVSGGRMGSGKRAATGAATATERMTVFTASAAESSTSAVIDAREQSASEPGASSGLPPRPATHQPKEREPGTAARQGSDDGDRSSESDGSACAAPMPRHRQRRGLWFGWTLRDATGQAAALLKRKQAAPAHLRLGEVMVLPRGVSVDAAGNLRGGQVITHIPRHDAGSLQDRAGREIADYLRARMNRFLEEQVEVAGCQVAKPAVSDFYRLDFEIPNGNGRSFKSAEDPSNSEAKRNANATEALYAFTGHDMKATTVLSAVLLQSTLAPLRFCVVDAEGRGLGSRYKWLSLHSAEGRALTIHGTDGRSRRVDGGFVGSARWTLSRRGDDFIVDVRAPAYAESQQTGNGEASILPLRENEVIGAEFKFHLWVRGEEAREGELSFTIPGGIKVDFSGRVRV
jgi:hypothetical protein